MSSGGKRKGAGRKPLDTPRTVRGIRCTLAGLVIETLDAATGYREGTNMRTACSAERW